LALFKPLHMKRFCLFVLGLVMASTTFAANEWKEYFSNESVKIFYRYVDCHDKANGIHQQKVVLKFENISAKKLEVTFGKTTVYSGTKAATDDVKTYKVTVPAGKGVEGECDTRDNNLFIFSKHLDFSGPELKKFDLTNISVKTIE
jgi:hypothetical protein